MRKFWSSPEDYDRRIRDYIRITPEQAASKESHAIWGYFQEKFTMINGKIIIPSLMIIIDLGKYQEFFKKLLYEILIKCAH